MKCTSYSLPLCCQVQFIFAIKHQIPITPSGTPRFSEDNPFRNSVESMNPSWSLSHLRKTSRRLKAECVKLLSERICVCLEHEVLISIIADMVHVVFFKALPRVSMLKALLRVSMLMACITPFLIHVCEGIFGFSKDRVILPDFRSRNAFLDRSRKQTEMLVLWDSQRTALYLGSFSRRAKNMKPCKVLPVGSALNTFPKQRLDRRHQVLGAVAAFKVFIDHGMDLLPGNSFCIWRLRK